FQRSGDTISGCLHKVIDAVVSPGFYRAYVKLPNPNETSPHIRNNPKFWPYFANCIGAIDGTQKPCLPPAAHADAYRNRK
ncbi:hypothetical protein BKA62DRAFT_599614, partial [Auriculariales sp. MPI-PUGE-AT-0066]